MNFLDGLLGQTFGMAWGNDARALSDGELAQMAARDSYLARNSQPGIQEIIGMMNYRHPVIVPHGWAEWYEFGAEVN